MNSRWEEQLFDVLIFSKNDRTRFPEKLLNVIDTSYRQDPQWKAIDVYYRISGQ